MTVVSGGRETADGNVTSKPSKLVLHGNEFPEREKLSACPLPEGKKDSAKYTHAVWSITVVNLAFFAVAS